MHLLDTEVVYALREAKGGRADPALTAWASGAARTSLFLSALTLLELETAVARAERKDKTQGPALRDWLDNRVGRAFDGRILPIDAAVVRRRASVSLTDGRDALLAATALEHGLTLVTRDPAFAKLPRLKLLNPWAYKPDLVDEDEDWGQAAKAGAQWLRNIFVRG
ncbi:type II toxin-antitoxin system VapC family toxin [Caulobacter segnis]|uniref:Ribonuclease VapC n=2 Tax=Caulobacter segnis TaxID=88688 RepID=D5VG46_CAUST|nr:PIN domain-containing protein [Caulobacter segnis]ADG10049.1 PilT protein domain protein [Caulobacter segnis ATCC 21756]AVQ01805.1 type II toxin-antitoxin system VapC family toxin [Caulobacter segnis]